MGSLKHANQPSKLSDLVKTRKRTDANVPQVLPAASAAPTIHPWSWAAGEKLYAGPIDEWRCTNDGVIIKRDNNLIRHDGTVLYANLTHRNAWFPHPRGVVVERAGTYALNGREVLAEKDQVEHAEPCPIGLLILTKDHNLSIDGGAVIAGNVTQRSFLPVADGAIVTRPTASSNKTAFVRVPGSQKAMCTLSERQSLWWSPHPQGIAHKDDRKVILNEDGILYEGPMTSWKPTIHGLLVLTGNTDLCRFLLNGTELLYEGEYKDFEPHPLGLAVRLGDEIRLFRNRYASR